MGFLAFLTWINDQKRSRYVFVLPFLLLFLYSSFQYAKAPPYTFGTDDAFYYSYVSSIFIDHDLELVNQYELSGLAKLNPRSIAGKTSIGYTTNIYPIGLSFFWTPFFLIGECAARIANAPVDGYSAPFLLAVGIGNLFYVCAGLLFCYLFCRFWTSSATALFSTFALLLATPYLWFYFRSFVLVSEPLSFALAAFFLYFVRRFEGNPSRRICFFTGILLGMMTMVRFHNVLFGAVPAFAYFSSSRKRRLEKVALLAVGVIIGFLPQMVIWKLMNGSWLPDFGGSFIPWWNRPFITEVLFSSRKGLFPWCPILALCIPGLIVLWKKDRAWSAALLTVTVLTIWMNSAQIDWWGATSLGARRFVPLTPIFAAGLSAFHSRLKFSFKMIVVPIVVSLVFLNLYFVKSFRRGYLSYDHSDRFSDVLKGGYYPFRFFVYPLELPVHIAYRLKYGTPMYGPMNEFFIGEDVFHFQEKAGDHILERTSPLFGEGWKRDVDCRTSGSSVILYVPMFMKDTPRFFVDFSFEPAVPQKNVWIDFYWNGKFLRSRQVFTDGRLISLAIRPQLCRSDVNEFRLHIYSAKQENVQAPDLILREIQFRRDDFTSNLDLPANVIH